MVIICGPDSVTIGTKIGKILKVPVSIVKSKLFPDGETRLQLTCDVKGEDVTLVQSTHPPQDSHLVQLLLLLDTIKEEGASNIRVVAPYLAYARQDRRQISGEVVSANSIIRLLDFLGVNELVTVNVHNPEVFYGAGFNLVDISAVPLLAAYLKEKGYGGCFSLSLGKKAVDVKHAQEAAAVLNGGYGRLKTYREPSNGQVSLKEADFNVEGKVVAVFDDVITSGNTHLKVVDFLKERGATEVHLACVHSLLHEQSRNTILKAVDSFVCSDTVPNLDSKVYVASLISDKIAR